MPRTLQRPDRRQLLAALASTATASLMTGQARGDDGGRTSSLPHAPHGTVVAIGGALRFDNDAVWSRLVDLAGGHGSRWLVVGLASSHPEQAAARTAAVLRKHGARAEPLLFGAGSEAATRARDADVVARIQASAGVFFCGGAQERIVDVLNPGGVATPVLEAIRAVPSRAGVVAGTSAGAAVMSTTMFRDAQDSMAVLQGHLREGKEIDHGLGFVGPNLFVDQHFLKRGRIGRMLPMMAARGYTLGLGVDENSAAIISGDRVEIIGAKGALLVDLSGASSEPRGGAFGLRGAKLSYLDRGDRYDLAARRLSPSPQKLAGHAIRPNAPDFEPYYARSRYWPDMLGDTAIVNAMSELIDSGDREAFGVAAEFRPRRDATCPDLAFEFRLYKGDDSLGWFTGDFGGEDYSVANLYLDIVPVRLSLPIYRPWSE